MTGNAIAAAAHALVGARYRPGGRDPATGLDCLGVVAASLAAVGWHARLPVRSTLHRGDVRDAIEIAHLAGLVCPAGNTLAGDIMMVRCSPIQLHLLIAAGAERFIHAHASLRRVVLGPSDPAWTFVGRWRLPTQG